MPTSKIQAEFLKSTKIDADEYKTRQDYLKAVMDKVNTFKDPQWDKMSEEAQLWMNDAIKAFKGKKRLPDFADVGKVKPEAEDESEDDEDEAPKKKAKKPAADEDDEEEAPKKKKKPAADEDEADEDEADEDEADEDEAPKKKKKAAADDEDEAPKKKKKPAPDEDEEEDEPPKKKKKAVEEDDEEEDDAPKKKKKAAASDDDDEEEKPAKKKVASVPQKASGVKVAIKDAIILDPEISVDSIVKKLGKGGAEVSKVTVSNVRAEFRHTLKLLKERGKLKGIEL